jgi:hypothetical protein
LVELHQLLINANWILASFFFFFGGKQSNVFTGPGVGSLVGQQVDLSV